MANGKPWRIQARPAARAGVVLLEVLLALFILATVAAASAALATETVRAWSVAATRERELRQASDFLEAVSLWTREDLDRRLGDRMQGAWRLSISRPSPTLYMIALSDSAGVQELLRTALFRSEGSSSGARP